MRTLRAELLRSISRANLAFLLLLVALTAFAMMNAILVHGSLISGFRDVSIFLAVFLMGRAATAAANDYRTGTLRPWLISAPGRVPFFAGKLTASLVVSWSMGTAILAASLLASLALKSGSTPSQTWSTAAWFLLACGALTLFGHAIGVLVRSVPAALAITLAWILPGEAVASGFVDPANQWLPGLLLRSVTSGTIPAGMTPALVIAHSVLPFVLIEIAALIAFIRRDVTS